MASILQGNFKDMIDQLQEQADLIEKLAQQTNVKGSDEFVESIAEMKVSMTKARAAADKVVRAQERG